MRVVLQIVLLSLVCCVAFAQQPPPLSKEHEILKKDVGTWTGTMRIYQGDSEPIALPIKETSKIFGGGLWVITDFDAGPFQGHGQFGYDAAKKKYIGTWIDNTNPFMSVMEGDFDEEKQEMVMRFNGIDPATGNAEQMKSVSTMDGDDKRKFLMYSKKATDTDWVKSFEIDYTRAK